MISGELPSRVNSQSLYEEEKNSLSAISSFEKVHRLMIYSFFDANFKLTKLSVLCKGDREALFAYQ